MCVADVYLEQSSHKCQNPTDCFASKEIEGKMGARSIISPFEVIRRSAGPLAHTVLFQSNEIEITANPAEL